MSKIVIVGGGVAAYRALHRILAIDPMRDVTLVSDDDRPAYERPMLSKEALTSDTPLRSLGLREAFPNAREKFSTRASRIDRLGKRVVLADGEELSYDKLVLATGSRPRQLPAEALANSEVHYLRTAADAEKLKPNLCPGKTIAIIGGGFIGLEVAASARARGANAIVIETQQALLARVAPPSLSRWLFDLHKRNGVDIRLGTHVTRIEETDAGPLNISTSQGPIIADAVVVGIGIIPNTELASECGLAVNGGIEIDTHGRTSDPDIFAAGEATSYPVTQLGVSTRSECWTTASEQGTIVGGAVSGLFEQGYCEIPWLWSDQYQASIQYIGLPLGAFHTVTHPGLDQDSWLDVAWDDTGRFLGAIGVNANKQISEIRRALRKGLPVPLKFALEQNLAV